MSSLPPPPPPSSRWFYFFAGILVAVLVFTLGVGSFLVYSQFKGDTSEAATEAGTEMNLYNEAWDIIKQDFLGELPPDITRTYGAIRGSVETLEDPYTYFVEPEPAVREQEQLQGHFGGIGAFLEQQEDGRIRLRPMIDRPADMAGVLEGDILIAVDGETLPVPADLDATTDLIRGPVGTVVRLTVLRGEETLDFEIERQQIELPSVSWRVLEEAPETGYIRIERFSALTEKELAQALDELQASDAASNLILDLRGDPGGLLDSAIAVSSFFLDGGPVLLERHSDGSEKTYSASPGGPALDANLFVLVDGGTASAAEIVAGALQDRGRATLIGTTTYGKGSIQRIHRLSDDSALHVTFARWFTPDGHKIDGQGLSPDITINPDDQEEGKDLFLEAALEQIRNRINP